MINVEFVLSFAFVLGIDALSGAPKLSLHLSFLKPARFAPGEMVVIVFVLAYARFCFIVVGGDRYFGT